MLAGCSMGDHWTEPTSPLGASRVVPFVVDVVGLPHGQKSRESKESFRNFFLGRRWLDGGRFILRKGGHVDRSNGLQVLLPVSENSASATSSVVSRGARSGGSKRIDALIPTESRVAMESSSSFSMRNLGLEEHHLKASEFLDREEFANGKGATDLLSGYGSWDQTCAAMQSESEGSYELGSSPVFDESFYMDPTKMKAELHATSDAMDEMVGKVAIRLMVAEAVMRGIVRAVEVDASEAVEVIETELLKVKRELQDKDSTVIKLINTLKKKEEERVKLVEESRCKERHLVMDMLTERERILGKVKESDKYVAQKEKELLKMAEHMVELSLNLAAESKRVNILEKQVREAKDAEAVKGRELLAMMEKTEQFRSEKETIVEMVRREARLKELRLTESLAEKEKVLNQHLEKIRTLETIEQSLREELDVHIQKELQLSETLDEKGRVISQQLQVMSTLETKGKQLTEELVVRSQKEQELTEIIAEKEEVISQHLQAINTLETAEQQLREELDGWTQKELQTTQSLVEKVTLVSEHVRSLESAEEDLKEQLYSQSMAVQSLTESLSEKEEQLQKHVETIKSLELAEMELRELVETQSQKERFLMGELLEKDELIRKQLTTITTLESSEHGPRKEAEALREEVNKLLQSGKDSAEVLDKLRDAVKFHAETIEEKDRSLRFLQGEIELLNSGIEDLSSSNSTLTEKLNGYKVEAESQRHQILKQEAVIRESDFRCQELSLAEKRLQDELAALNWKVLQYVDAAQRAQEELREQSWKQEAEISLIMTTLEGRVVDIEREINLLGEESARNQAETVTFKSQTLQKRSLEISNLRSSKAALEAKLVDAQAAVKLLEEITKKEEEELANKDLLLQQAASRIAQLEQKLIENESLSHGVQKEIEEMMVRDENLKKQLKVSESEVQQVRHDLETITILEQEVRARELRLQSLVEDLEGKVWRLEFENTFISSYMGNASQDVLNLVVNVNKRLTTSSKTLVLLQHDLEAAGIELSKSRNEVDSLRSINLDLSASVERMQSNVESYAVDMAEARAGLQHESAKSERMKAHVCELHCQIEGLRNELECKLSRKEEEAMQLVSSIEECKWQSEVETFIVLGLAEGSIKKLLESLCHAREEIRNKSEDLVILRYEFEELSQKVRTQTSGISELKMALSNKTHELCTFKTDFVLQNAMQRDALVQEQSQAKEALKKIEELKRMKLTLLDRIQEEKLRWAQLEEALAEQKLKYQVEMDVVSTVMYEAGVTMAAKNLERDTEVARLLYNQATSDDSKKADTSRNVGSGTDSTTCSMKGKPGRAKIETKVSGSPLSKLDLLVRKNEELRREKEQLLTQKTDEIYKLKREFYKELERVKGERRKDYESDGSQKDSPKSKPRKPRQQAFIGPDVEPNDAVAKLEKVVLDHEGKVSEMRGFWDAEKSVLLDSLSQKENEIKELVTKLSSQSQAQKSDDSAKFGKVVADNERMVSEMRALWDAEKSTLLESISQRDDEIKELVTKLSLQTEVRSSDDCAKLEKVVADLERKEADMRALWDAEKSTLLESLSKRDDEIKQLVTKLSLQTEARLSDDYAKLEKVVADLERKDSEVRALWDTEKSVFEKKIQELGSNLIQALERERECSKRQASLEERLAAVEMERSRLKAVHEEEMENAASCFIKDLEVKSRQLSEAVKDAQEKNRRVVELDDEVRRVNDAVSVLRAEISSVRQQMEIGFAEEVQSWIASVQQLERGVTHRTKQYNLRLQRAHSLLNHLVRQFSLLASSETVHMQNLQNLTKAEAEVDLLGDEVDALMDVLEKVYTVLSHYHPVIQHYPGLADLAKVVRNEVLQRLRDSDDVSL
ncbi:hypothetical protein Mapa_004195 [Marchantia paleacea]|nr:hypothetical protein Mapa_004195 [Marchantia paleacea]